MALELLLRAIWAMRARLLPLVTGLFAAGAALVLLWPRSFVAGAVVAPAETSSIAVSSLLAPSPFAQGGLLDPRPNGNFAVYLGALRSPEAAAMLAREAGLLGRLTERRAAGPGGALRRALGLRVEADLDDAVLWLERRLAVTQSLASVTWTLELTDPDRAAALDALTRLHGFAEAEVRADLAATTRRRVAALEARLAEERDLFLRNALYELLAQQQRAGLVVMADEAVAARLVAPPSVELRPSVPNRPLLLGLLALAAPMAALLGAACLVLLRAPAGAARHPAPWESRVAYGDD
jgi:hypothetical protein